MSDLKNCPLCGDNNLSTGFDGLLKQHYISCVDCDLTIYGSKTGVIEAWNTRAQDALNDKGPWSAKQEPVTMSFNDVWVESEDFKHAVRLYVYGNFDGRKQCFSYAENIAEYLNDYDGVANQMREHVHRKSQLEAQDAEVKRLRGEACEVISSLMEIVTKYAPNEPLPMHEHFKMCNAGVFLTDNREALKGGE